MRFSVCIPTFRRPKGLTRALDSFQHQAYQGFFEIIACDNASDPKIEKQVLEYNGTAKVQVKYLSQDGGIQQVRSRLAYEAKGDLVLMIDDDESACPELLALYDQLFTRHEDIVAAGGPCVIRWEDVPPGWVKDYVEHRRETSLWGRYEPCDELKIGIGVNIWGGNMVFRRSIFAFTGFRPDILQGRNMGNGESGLIADIASRGLKTAFIPAAYVLHHMDKARYNMKYVRKTASYPGISFAYVRWHRADKSFNRFVNEAFKIGKQFYKSWAKYVYYYFFKNAITNKKICTEFHAHIGFFQIKYIFWLMTDPYLRWVCDQDDFRPESCLKFYHAANKPSG